MGTRAVVVVALLALSACGPSAHADPLCAALEDVQASGLAASVSGLARTFGGERDAADADRRRELAFQALARFRNAAPPEIADDAARVTAALEAYVRVLNDPFRNPLLPAVGGTPEQHAAFVASARRVNAVTEPRCGAPLVDPASLQS